MPRFTLPLVVVSLVLSAVLVRAADTTRLFLPLVANAPAPANDLPVLTATFLGGAAADSPAAIDIAPDGTLVVAGSFPGYTPVGITPLVLDNGTTGTVIRLNSSGTAALSLTRIGAAINDMEIDGDRRIIVCGDFGVAALSIEADAILWRANPGEGRRCAVGADGTVALIANSSAYVYDADGNALKTWSIGGSSQADIAVDGASKTVIASGYTQKDVGGQCAGTLQVAFVRGWNYSGQQKWQSYDWSAQQAQSANVCADTRGERVAIGRDGKLYLAATINGGTGASIFARDPKAIDQKLDGLHNVTSDPYNNAYNTGSIKMTWFGRYNPIDGSLLKGSSLLTRLSDGKGNSIAPFAISADTDGGVYLAGSTACCLPDRDKLTIGGVGVGTYEGGEGFIAVFSPDLKTRQRWTPLAGPAPASAGGSPAVGIAVRNGNVAATLAFAPKSGANRNLITKNALQPTQAGDKDGYIVVWK